MQDSKFNDNIANTVYITNESIDTGPQLLPAEMKVDMDEASTIDESMISPNIDDIVSEMEIKIEESIIASPVYESTKIENTNNSSRKRLSSISAVQKNAMLDFMEKHPNLRSGKFSSTFHIKTSKILWMTLTEKLNALPGATKDWKHWRKTWQDIKKIDKKRNRICSGHSTQSEPKNRQEPVIQSQMSKEQKDTMLDFMKKHPNLCSSHNSAFRGKAAMQLWMLLAETLNAIPGTRREWTHWRRTWCKMKGRANVKHREKKSANPDESINNLVQPFNMEPTPNIMESLVKCDWWCNDKVESVDQISLTDEDISIEENCIENAHEVLSPEHPIPDVTTNPRVLEHKEKVTYTTIAEQNLSDTLAARNEYMKSYYERKLQLMARNIEVKEEIADSLKVIARKLSENS